MKAKILETERLILKPLSLEHLTQDYVNWLNDEEVYRYLETGGNYTLEMLEDYLMEVIKKDIYFWGIHIKENDLHIGNIKLDPIDELAKKGELGTLIGNKSYWSKGYGTEAKVRVVKFGFQNLKLIKITSGCYANNLKIRKINKKMGFVEEGVFKMDRYNKHDKKIHDIIRMAIFNPQNKY